MPANFFQEEDYQALVARLKALTADADKKWGKMNVLQMLRHCSSQLKLGLGQLEQPTYEGSFMMRTRFGVWLSLYGMPWPRGLPTPSKMNMLRNEVAPESFEAEREVLSDLMARVQNASALKPHPFFGPLNKQDWGRLIWKHLNHHLKQFGA